MINRNKLGSVFMVQPIILQIDHLSKQFPGGAIPAIDGVTLTLPQGDLLSLLGPSGCGKTTLLRLIAGFERPQTGSIQLAGRTVAGPGAWLPPEQRDVGMVFQDYALFPHLTVAGNIAFGLQANDRKSGMAQLIQQRVTEVLALVGLEGLEKRYPHELSGGQQQRVALARALAPRPALVLLDEPLSNLDATVRLRLRQEIRAILKAAGTSAVFVTHDQEEALSISDWVAVMRRGQVEQVDRPEIVYRDPSSRFVAEFVAQANFLPAQRQAQGWETEVGCFQVAESHSDQPLQQGELMIRQEDLQLQQDDNAPVIIHDRQFLGREHRYCLRTPSGRELHARTSTDVELSVGQHVQVSAIAAALRVFPPA